MTYNIFDTQGIKLRNALNKLDKKILPAYIVVGSTALSSGWLSDTVGGTALTPEIGVLYMVMSSGDYLDRLFRYNGTAYEQVGGGGAGGAVGTKLTGSLPTSGWLDAPVFEGELYVPEDIFVFVTNIEGVYDWYDLPNGKYWDLTYDTGGVINNVFIQPTVKTDTLGTYRECNSQSYSGYFQIKIYTNGDIYITNTQSYRTLNLLSNHANGIKSKIISNAAIKTNSYAEMFLNDSGGVNAYSKTDGSVTVIRDSVPTSPIPYTLQVVETSNEGAFEVINSYVPTIPETPTELPVTYKKISANLTPANWVSGSESWTAIDLHSSTSWRDITYGLGRYVAISLDGKAAYSTDGITWAETTLPSTASWTSIAYGNGKFVVVANTSNKAAYSTDGITWTETTLPSNTSWTSIAYGNGKFVVISYNDNKVAYSTDGITWTSTTLPSILNYISLTFGNGKFVAVAQATNKAAYSTDGITWAETTLPSTASWTSIAYGNGKFVVVAIYSEVVLYSLDGISWVQGTMSSNKAWNYVTYGGDRFIATVQISNVLAYSTDGITWTETTAFSSSADRHIAYGNYRFVSVALSGVVDTWVSDNTYMQTISDNNILVNSAVKAFINYGKELIAGNKTSGSIEFLATSLPTESIAVTVEVFSSSTEGVFEIINSYVPTVPTVQVFSNTSVAVASFVADTTYEDYGYRASVALTGVTADLVANVVFGLEEAISGNYAPISETYAGGVYIYATAVPDSAITIPTITVMGD